MEKDLKNKKTEEKLYKRHKRIWTFARVVLGPPILRAFRCKSAPAPENLPEPYIVLPNHSCDLDPALVGVSFKHQMYFVASEHVYRKGFASKLLRFSFAPIAKIKGASDKQMVMKVLRTIREGKNVCIFPEGNRSFNGHNSEITDAIGKLVRVSGANLVTYKITGGYFTNPRWGFGLRKGKMTGGVVNVYTKETLNAMAPEQITEIIRNDISENAYARQKTEKIAYKGKNLAEGMECALTVCPECEKVNVIFTKKNSIFCKTCGHLADYNEYGYFESKKSAFTFETVEQWDNWQESYYEKMVEKSETAQNKDEIFFSDESVSLRTVNAEHQVTDLGNGILSLSSQELKFVSSSNSLSLSIKDIPDMGLYAKTGLVFTDSQGIHYELHTDRIINVRKYASVWNILRNKLKAQ